MKRIVCLMVLTALVSPASARDSYFTFHGHRIHIHTARHCRSLSCISLSIPGVHWRRGRDRDADDIANTTDPAQTPAPSAPAQTQLPPAPAPAQVQPPPAPAQAQPLPPPPPLPPQPQARPALLMAQAAPPAVTRTPTPAAPAAATAPALAPVQTDPVPAPTLAAAPPPVQVALPASKPAVQVTSSTPPAAPPPSVGFDVAKPVAKPAQNAPVPAAPVVAQPAPQASPQVASPQVARAAEESDDGAIDTPIGDWQTEGKGGLVRIEACGEALCGYVLNPTTRAKGETVLVNMKAKNVTQWAGDIYSRSSGNSYYGTMTLKGPNALRVEACVVGKFFCRGNNWTRIEESRSIGSNEMATSRHRPGARS